MGKLVLIIVLIVVTVQVVFSKTLGNFQSYKQITDKEVLFITSNGSRILITANQPQIIGVRALGAQEKVSLTLPCNIQESGLTGSFYVEELDNQIEISSTSNKGLRIRINKQPFLLSYVDPQSKDILVDEFKAIDFSKNMAVLYFSKTQNDNLALHSGNNNIRPIEINSIHQETEEPIAIVSSKGYCILVDCNTPKQVQLTKQNKLNLSVQNKEAKVQYYIVTGSNQHDVLQQLALFNSKFEGIQITQK